MTLKNFRLQSGIQQIIQQQTNAGQQEGPPPSKRSRTEGDLIPADAFNQQHPFVDSLCFFLSSIIRLSEMFFRLRNSNIH